MGDERPACQAPWPLQRVDYPLCCDRPVDHEGMHALVELSVEWEILEGS